MPTPALKEPNTGFPVDPTIVKWMENPNWKSMDYPEQEAVLSNYFDDKIANDSFFELPLEEQNRIKNNFKIAHIGENPEPERAAEGLKEPEFTFSRLYEQTKRSIGLGAADIATQMRVGEERATFDEVLKKDPVMQMVAKNATPEELEKLRERHELIRNKVVGGLKQFAEAQPELLPGTSGVVESAVSGMARFFPSMGISAVSPMAGLITTYTQIAGMKYAEYEKQPDFDPERAYISSQISALAQTPLEFAGNLLQIGALKNMGSAFFKGTVGKKLGSTLQAIAAGVFGEGMEEFLQQYPDEIADIWYANKDLSDKQIVAEIKKRLPQIHRNALEAAKIGAVGGGLLAGAAGVVASPTLLYEYKSEQQKKIDKAKALNEQGTTDILEQDEVDKILKKVAPKTGLQEPVTQPETIGGLREAPVRTTEPSEVPPEMMEDYYAQGLREDERQIYQGRDEQEGRREEGGEDLEQQAQEEPGYEKEALSRPEAISAVGEAQEEKLRKKSASDLKKTLAHLITLRNGLQQIPETDRDYESAQKNIPQVEDAIEKTNGILEEKEEEGKISGLTESGWRNIEDQKSLEEVGTKIAQKMGIKNIPEFEFLGDSNVGYRGRYFSKQNKIKISTVESKNQRDLRNVVAHELLHTIPEYRYMPEGIEEISLGDLSKLSEKEFNELLPALKKAKNHPQEFYDKLKELWPEIDFKESKAGLAEPEREGLVEKRPPTGKELVEEGKQIDRELEEAIKEPAPPAEKAEVAPEAEGAEKWIEGHLQTPDRFDSWWQSLAKARDTARKVGLTKDQVDWKSLESIVAGVDAWDNAQIKEEKAEEKPTKPETTGQFKKDLENKGAARIGNIDYKILQHETTGSYYFQKTEDGVRYKTGGGGANVWSREYAIDRALKDAQPYLEESIKKAPEVDKKFKPLVNMFKRKGFDIAPVEPTLTEEQNNIVKIGSAMGLNVHFFELDKMGDTGLRVGGYHRPKTGDLFINALAEKPALQILGHESLHRLRKQYPKLYNNFLNILPDLSAYEDALNALIQDRKDVGVEITKDQAMEELVAEITGNLFTRKPFWNELFAKDKTLGETLAKIVSDILEKIKTFIPQNKGLSQTEKALADVYSKFVEREKAEARTKELLKKKKSGIKYKEKIQVAETGEIIEGERDAIDALKEVQADLTQYRQLLDCIAA